MPRGSVPARINDSRVVPLVPCANLPSANCFTLHSSCVSFSPGGVFTTNSTGALSLKNRYGSAAFSMTMRPA